MNYTDFREMLDESLREYEQENYEQALKILEENQEDYPEQAPLLYNWRICLNALQGNNERALQLMQEGLSQGYWWDEQLLREDPDLASLQDDPEFERMAAQSKERHEEASVKTEPQLLVLEPNEAYPAPHPLLIAIHGRNSNSQEFAAYWQHLTDEGWMIALPQSSQILMPNTYSWDDDEKARREILAHYDTLVEEYTIAPRQVVLAGFSQGGGLAISLALDPNGPGRRFIAVAPYLEDVDRQLPEPRTPEARGYLVIGIKDSSMDFKLLDDRLQELKIPYSKEIHPEMGHEIPPAFDETLLRAMEFLFEE